MNRARLLNVAGVAIGIAGVAFVTVRVVRDWDQITDAFASATLAWLVGGLLTGWAAMTLIGLAWLWVIRCSRMSPTVPVDNVRGLSWFFVGQLGKYVPGGIWPVVGQAELAHRGTVPRRLAYSSTAWSMIGTFVGAAAVGAVTGLIALDDERWVALLIAVALAVAAVLVAAPPTRQLAARTLARATRRDLRLPTPAWLAALVGRHLPVWILFPGMNVFAVVALGADLDAELVVRLIAVTCLSWMAGFVIIGLPGGLGVRETIFISMMSAPLGSAVAVSAAVISRVVSVVVDTSAAGVSTIAVRRARSTATTAVDEPVLPH